MKVREIKKHKNYFDKFIKKLHKSELELIFDALVILKSKKEFTFPELVKKMKNGNGIYELRVKSEQSIFRVFYFYDGNDVVVLFQGIKKKDKKRQQEELKKAIKLKKEYEENK